MTLTLEVKEIHIHVHLSGDIDESEALAKINNLGDKIANDTAAMKVAVDEGKKTT